MKPVVQNYKQAIDELEKGNTRFCSGLKSVYSLSAVYQMEELAQKGQKPFAIIISCSDSRAPAETIFDQGLGDLFVIRVAGNIVNDDIVASLEFAALTFQTSLCLVMGHTQCGAISASIAARNGETKLPSKSLERLVEKIEPAILKFVPVNKNDREQMIAKVTENNVINSIDQIIEKSLIVRDLLSQEKFHLAGSVYDIASGKVNIFHHFNSHLLKGK